MANAPTAESPGVEADVATGAGASASPAPKRQHVNGGPPPPPPSSGKSRSQSQEMEADEESHGSQAAREEDQPWFMHHNYPIEANLSQTDNPNTPIAGRYGYELDGPALRDPKSIQDRVHGQITLPGLLIAVMDTAAFQRLDRVRQLGGCYFVYPSATHTRKEHSLGVAYLAGYMARHLMEQQPELEINESDVLCVELAGLVHDLGHGPFSHMFEEFMQIMAERDAANGAKVKPKKWEHEEMSRDLLDQTLRENDIPVAAYFEREGVEREKGCSHAQATEHMNFVKKLIDGLGDKEPWPTNIGRPESKRFLFDIVNNKRSGVDVDKLDYLVRDSMAAFGSSSKVPGFDIYRIITSSRVLLWNRDKCRPEVCFQMKNALEILEIYSLRAKLHRQVYQHRIANVAEAMITDVFVAADEHFRLRASNGGRGVRLSEAARDREAFVRLNDSILDAIDLSVDEGLGEAASLLERLRRRDFYQQVGNKFNIETMPRCAKCREGTPIEARYCAKCGETTATRNETFDKKSGLKVSKGVVLKASDVRTQLLELIAVHVPHIRAELEEANALFIKIVDIQNGKRTDKKDPLGTSWQVYDPLARVHFYNPKGGIDLQNLGNPELLRTEKVPQMYMPASYHTRTLFCYLRTEKPGWREAVEASLSKWARQQGLDEQEGTSNASSPAVHRAKRGTPGSTSRGRMLLGSQGKAQPSNLYQGESTSSRARLSSISEDARPTAEK